MKFRTTKMNYREIRTILSSREIWKSFY